MEIADHNPRRDPQRPAEGNPQMRKSRQTPARFLAVSMAEVDSVLDPYLYFSFRWIQARIAYAC